jgi:hypothetical protein
MSRGRRPPQTTWDCAGMRRDLQAMERERGAGIHSRGECPGASAQGR